MPIKYNKIARYLTHLYWAKRHFDCWNWKYKQYNQRSRWNIGYKKNYPETTIGHRIATKLIIKVSRIRKGQWPIKWLTVIRRRRLIIWVKGRLRGLRRSGRLPVSAGKIGRKTGMILPFTVNTSLCIFFYLIFDIAILTTK